MDLTFSPAEEAFRRNDQNLLDVDCLIVDETSMLDLLLTNHLLKAVDPAAHVLFVGDVGEEGPGDLRGMKELFFNGRPMTLARWPNEGWVKTAGAAAEGGKFNYEGDRPLRWQHADDIWVHGKTGQLHIVDYKSTSKDGLPTIEGEFGVSNTSLDLEAADLSAADAARTLVYAINSFAQAKRGEFTLTSLSTGFKALMAETAQKVRGLRGTLDARGADGGPILNDRGQLCGVIPRRVGGSRCRRPGRCSTAPAGSPRSARSAAARRFPSGRLS